MLIMAFRFDFIPGLGGGLGPFQALLEPGFEAGAPVVFGLAVILRA